MHVVQDIWPHLTNLKWIHSASAGVEKLLFPELVKSSVTVTNAKVSFTMPAIDVLQYHGPCYPRCSGQRLGATTLHSHMHQVNDAHDCSAKFGRMSASAHASLFCSTCQTWVAAMTLPGLCHREHTVILWQNGHWQPAAGLPKTCHASNDNKRTRTGNHTM